MTPPTYRFDKEELTLTLTGVGAGWTLGQLGQLRLFDQAQVRFPSSWSDFQIKLSTHIVQTQWQLRSTLLLQSTLESGITVTRGGTSAGMSASTELTQHLMHRPLVSVDLYLNVKLEGTASRQDGFSGQGAVTLGIRGRF